MVFNKNGGKVGSGNIFVYIFILETYVNVRSLILKMSFFINTKGYFKRKKRWRIPFFITIKCFENNLLCFSCLNYFIKIVKDYQFTRYSVVWFKINTFMNKLLGN